MRRLPFKSRIIATDLSLKEQEGTLIHNSWSQCFRLLPYHPPRIRLPPLGHIEKRTALWLSLWFDRRRGPLLFLHQTARRISTQQYPAAHASASASNQWSFLRTRSHLVTKPLPALYSSVFYMAVKCLANVDAQEVEVLTGFDALDWGGAVEYGITSPSHASRHRLDQ